MARKAKKQIDLLEMLRGGDRRSIGRSDQVAGMVSVDLRLFSRLMEGLWSQDELVRMRAADAAEKVTRDHRELLRPYKREIGGVAGGDGTAGIAMASGGDNSAAGVAEGGAGICDWAFEALLGGPKFDCEDVRAGGVGGVVA